MKILHITDDNIFFDNAIEQFEYCYPNQNHTIVWSENQKLSKIKQSKNIKIKKNNDFTEIDKISKYDVLVMHSLNIQNSKFVNKITDSSVKTIWLLHGYEVYGLDDFKPNEIYDTLTLNAFNLKRNFSNNIKNIIRPIAETVLKTQSKTIKEAIAKADYMGVLYKEEYDFLKHKFNYKAKWLPFTFYPLEKIIPNKTEITNTGNNIFIGNSASLTSNHLDIFEKLKLIGLLDNQKIICPLSYGNKEYANKLIKIGVSYFPEKFEPLTEFLKIDEYNEIIFDCSVTIMNHHVQQGVGNLLAMIYSGSKVFLSEKNSLFHYLKRIGVFIFSIEDDLTNLNDLLPLNVKMQQENKNIIKSEFNQEKLFSELNTNLIKLSK